MRENISPEEKLLKLIKGEKSINLSDKTSQKDKDGGSAVNKKAQAVNFRLGNNVLFRLALLLIVISVAYLIGTFIYPWVGLNKVKLPDPEVASIEQSVERKTDVKPYEFYAQGMKNSQIFGSIASQGNAEPAANIKSEIIKDINLVGIISGDNPQAVIEDKKTQKTYYVTKGQLIGDLLVDDIQEGKIILISAGQKFELYL